MSAINPFVKAPTSREVPKSEYQWNRRVLVVEDEREIGRLYQEILTGVPAGVLPLKSSRRAPSAGLQQVAGPEFEVTVVHSAEEALARVKHSHAKGEPFAMGFFDVLLGPGMDGIELVRQVHKIQPHICAVFVTAYHDRSVDAIKSVLTESPTTHWDYLNKPFSSGEILQKARNFVSLWNLIQERAHREELLAEAHRQLLANERMTSVAAVARGVSHEFGNILMQIMGKADLGRNKSEAEMRKTLDVILDASQRASEILDRFKNLSNSGGDENPMTSVNLAQLIQAALDLMEHTFKSQSVKICQIKMDPVQVVANGTALMQVLINLMINAIHAMGGSGQIDLSLTEVSDGAELRIRDYGPGVKPELLEKILEPFFTTKGSKGTGLGLSIAREIVEVEHRGQMVLQNHAVKGLEVILRLPFMPGGEESHEPA